MHGFKILIIATARSSTKATIHAYGQIMGTFGWLPETARPKLAVDKMIRGYLDYVPNMDLPKRDKQIAVHFGAPARSNLGG